MILKLSKLQHRAKSAREKALVTLLDFLDNQKWILYPSSEFISQQDNSLYRLIAFQVIRNLNRYQWLAAKLANRPFKKIDIEAQACILLGLAQLELGERVSEHAAIQETVELMLLMKKPHLKGMVNACLRRFQREEKDFNEAINQESLSLQYSHPQWLIRRWENKFGLEATKKILEANHKQPLTSLVLSPEVKEEEFIARLEEQGFEFSTGPLSATKSQGLFETEAFKDGEFFIQDYSSQKVIDLISEIPKEKVLDACASPGGKLFHTEWKYGSQITKLVGLELDEKRFIRLEANHLRLRSTSILLQGTTAQFNGEKFDLLLVDAPCSATGNIKKYPEIKYLRDTKGFVINQKLQLSILDNLKPFVKQGGHILYSTCSLEEEENHKLVQLFLTQNPKFELAPFAAGEEITEEGYYQALPDATQLGAFAALLKRIS